MGTVSVHPSLVVLGTLEALARDGIAVDVGVADMPAALRAGADLLCAIGFPPTAPQPDTATGQIDAARPVGRGLLSAVDATVVGLPVWTGPAMREALSRRDVGAVYRLLGRHGVSQRRIAAATGLSRSEISEIIAGRPVMSCDVLAWLADGLGVARGLLGLDPSGTATGRPRSSGGQRSVTTGPTTTSTSRPHLRVVSTNR